MSKTECINKVILQQFLLILIVVFKNEIDKLIKLIIGVSKFKMYIKQVFVKCVYVR